LEAVEEVEERLGPVAVVDEAVEGREERHSIRHRAGVDIRMRLPAAVPEPDAERAEALLRVHPLGVAQSNRLHLRIPALREVPEPVPAHPPDDGYDAARVEDLEHERDVASAPPRMLLVTASA